MTSGQRLLALLWPLKTEAHKPRTAAASIKKWFPICATNLGKAKGPRAVLRSALSQFLFAGLRSGLFISKYLNRASIQVRSCGNQRSKLSLFLLAPRNPCVEHWGNKPSHSISRPWNITRPALNNKRANDIWRSRHLPLWPLTKAQGYIGDLLVAKSILPRGYLLSGFVYEGLFSSSGKVVSFYEHYRRIP